MFRRRFCVCILCAILAAAMAAVLWLVPPSISAADPPPKNPSFINDVAPILKEHCFACHDARKRSGQLDMTTFAQLRIGGRDGDPITDGKPEESLLVERIMADGAKRMPPPPKDRPGDRSAALPPQKVGVIAQWIRNGAKLDSELTQGSNLLRELRRRWQPPWPPSNYAHPIVISALAFTPDGQRLIAAGYHEITIWNAADGKLLARLHTRAERTYGIAFLRENLVVVAGGRPGQEGDVCIYNLAAPASKGEDGIQRWDGVGGPGVLLSRLVESDDCILALALSGDSKKLAAGGCDRQIHVWDVSDPGQAKLEQSFENHSDWVLGLAFSPDVKLLASASRDKTAKLWDLAKHESVQSFAEHQQPVYSVAFRCDGKAGISVGGDHMLRIWTIDGAAKSIKVVEGHGDDVFKVVAVPGRPEFVTASADRTVRLWNEDGAAIRTLNGMGDQVESLAVSPDRTRIAAGCWDGQVRIWKLADGASLAAFSACPGYTVKPAAPK